MPVLVAVDSETRGVAVNSGEDIVDNCRRGDPGAFRELFEMYKDRVYSVALRYCGDAVLAQDIAQDTFIKVFATIGSFRGDAKFDSWLYRLVVNRCFDHKRKASRMMPLVDGLLSVLRAPSANALDEIMRTETSGQLRSIVAALPPEQRMVIVLRYTQDLSYEEIAEIMGCSAGTVGSRLNRVHKLLEARLSRVSGIKGKYRV
jgi:RNA polymerase sigma-70 factor (ECF subfamily)